MLWGEENCLQFSPIPSWWPGGLGNSHLDSTTARAVDGILEPVGNKNSLLVQQMTQISYLCEKGIEAGSCNGTMWEGPMKEDTFVCCAH